MRRTGDTQGAAGFTLLEILFAIVLLGIGVGTFMKMKTFIWSSIREHSGQYRAGQLIDSQVEEVRLSIALDTAGNWPPRDTSFLANGILVSRSVLEAHSPRDGAPLANVRMLRLVAVRGSEAKDTLKVWTYVTKRF